MLEYTINAKSIIGGKAQCFAGGSDFEFDASSGRDDILPNPAELLLSALAACILKNVERYSEKLRFPYREAKIEVKGIRNDNPPFMKEIVYSLEIDTEIEDRKLEMWHKNIIKFGTITNTLLKAVEIKGKISKMNINNNNKMKNN
ncbi:MAG: OsmC family peroxiredoxin [Bacteroidetes bacterium]|nr:MAG: OsmC family peroxiredoxin [Bacteroidota bacterium]